MNPGVSDIYCEVSVCERVWVGELYQISKVESCVLLYGILYRIFNDNLVSSLKRKGGDRKNKYLM